MIIGSFPIGNSCVRRNGGGSDKDLLDIEWNTKLLQEMQSRHVMRLYFTGAGVKKWFMKLFPDAQMEMVSLISRSAQSVRALGGREDFKHWKKKNPNLTAYDFILIDYKRAFQRG